MSAPYEAPEKPEILIETANETPAVSADRILRYLEQSGLVDPPADRGYTAEEAEKIKERLTKLGYIEQ